MAEARWYQNAIIYQLHVRAFADSDDDGIGDLRGLISRLDYLRDLGVTAIWLLPFYPSPLRDDGYDIADYYGIHPSYGTLEDVRRLLDEAHRRGMRVITELVINHTSDQHEWFRRSRRAAPGEYWRDWYVWSDDPGRYRDARIIFKDFEASNWTWDPVARAYYWHRFYSHQPDLNFDHPEVRAAIVRVMDFWLEMGVDGLRLDAIPYLYEREGTSCENLPETHAFLRELRRHVDEKFPDRMLLAEANQWPEDAVSYFGAGDECHMCFHFPLMPRLFMALRMEDRYSIVDILRQTPSIPASSQWATFLRNHDELTLEMVTDEERDYMQKVYAADPQARINLGIRRRLAPLVGNDRRQIELLNALLFSLPGTPVLYYGDEIGMGDNIFLGDRNGVRTPFQWSPDRNAGFSRANPQRLFLPVISSPEYHYQAVNVETSQGNVHSLLWWMKRLIAVRRGYPELGHAPLTFTAVENPRVLAFTRRTPERVIAVVANLSRSTQYAELDWREFRGRVPVELFGGTELPPVGDALYFLTLSPYAWFWFELEQRESPEQRLVPRRTRGGELEVPAEAWEALGDPAFWRRAEPELLAYLLRERWFAGKSRRMTALRPRDVLRLPSRRAANAALVVLEVAYAEGDPEQYLLTVGYAEGTEAHGLRAEHPERVIVDQLRRRGVPDGGGLFYDVLPDATFGVALLEAALGRREWLSARGQVVPEPVRDGLLVPEPELPAPTSVGTDASNTSLAFGKRFHLKVYRRIEPGENPEIEIGRKLAEQSEFSAYAPMLASVRHRIEREDHSLLVVQAHRENQGDGWRLMSHELSRTAEQALTLRGELETTPDESNHAFAIADHEPPVWLRELAGYALSLAEQLGERTGEMHRALASFTDDPAFALERFTPFYQRALYQSVRNSIDRGLGQLRLAAPRLPETERALAGAALLEEEEWYRRLGFLKGRTFDACRIRLHGDLHLAQTLFNGRDFVIVDFEGEPSRSIGERRIKRSPLRDVAGMLRSFEYVGEHHLRDEVLREEDRRRLRGVVNEWQRWTGARFAAGYWRRVQGAGLIPPDRVDRQRLLSLFLLEKCLYELRYELASRPEWIEIPLRGLLRAGRRLGA